MSKKTLKVLLVLLGIYSIPVFLSIGFVAYLVLRPLPPITPLPNPNAYDELVKAAGMLTDTIPDYDKMSQEELRKAVTANAAALSLARAGLSNQCRVPIQYSESYISNHLDDLASLKRLARAFVAEGRLAEMDGRTNDAVRDFLDTICLGNESMRGGVLIDELVGIAIKATGTSDLQKLVSALDARTCRETAVALEDLDSKSPTWSEVAQQENAWRKAFARIQKRNISKAEARSFQKIDQSCKLKLNTQEQKTRRLMIDLAAQAYTLDKGKPPTSAADLVPDYLKAVPQDPVTGKNLD